MFAIIFSVILIAAGSVMGIVLARQLYLLHPVTTMLGNDTTTMMNIGGTK